MNQQQHNYYEDKLNEYEFITYLSPENCSFFNTCPEITFAHTVHGDEQNRIREADRSLPLLRKFLTNRNCPVTKIKINDCMILKRGILDILKENKTVTELNITYCTITEKEVLNKIADFLKGNRTIQKLGLHLFITYYMANENNPEPRKLFNSLLGTSVSHLDLRQNFLDFDVLEDLKKVIPKLKLQSLNLRDNLKEKITKKVEDSVVYIVRKNIFLEKILVDNISLSTVSILEMNMKENKCIRRFFKIYLENCGPKRLGIMDAQTRQSIRDPKKPRLDIDVRRIINQYIPRNIEEGVDNFISWLENVEKCLDHIRGYDITQFIQSKSDISYFMENNRIVDRVIKKLKRYARYHHYSLTEKKPFHSNLSIGKKQTRGRKRKISQVPGS